MQILLAVVAPAKPDRPQPITLASRPRASKPNMVCQVHTASHWLNTYADALDSPGMVLIPVPMPNDDQHPVLTPVCAKVRAAGNRCQRMQESMSKSNFRSRGVLQ